MSRILAVAVMWACCLSAARAQNSASADQLDNQLWNETQIVFPLVKERDAAGKSVQKLSFYLQTNLRLGRNASRFITRRIGFGFDYRVNRYVSITPSYVYIFTQSPASREKQYESRLRLAVTLEKKWKKFSLDDRSLFEYRFRNSSNSDAARYRNRLRLRVPVKRGDRNLFTAYAWNEIYYDFTPGEFSRNQFSFGAIRELRKSLSADFFYLRRETPGETPRRVNAFGVNLTVTID